MLISSVNRRLHEATKFM